MAVTVKRNYLNWKPVKHVVFKSDEFVQRIHTTGFSVFEGPSSKEVSFQKDYCPPDENSPIEMYIYDDNYMMDFSHFFYNYSDRQHFVEKGKVETSFFPEILAKGFEELSNLNNIQVANELDDPEATTTNCQLIIGQDGVNSFEEANTELAKLIVEKAPKSKNFFRFLKRSE